MPLKKSFLFFLSLYLGACSLQPPYHPPCEETPEKWKNSETEENYELPTKWWLDLNDPLLNELEEKGLKNNFSIEKGVAAVLQARALFEQARSTLYPTVLLTPSYQVQGLEVFNLMGQLQRVRQELSTIPIQASYEVDLFQKNRNLTISARSAWQASFYDLDALYLSLTADIATTYALLCSLKDEARILKDTIDLRRNALEVNKSRYEGGLANVGDVDLAELELANAEADLFESIRSYKVTENALATLIGENASFFTIDAPLLVNEPPKIQPFFSSTLLERRPDVQAQERMVRSAYADVGVALANFFPSFELSSAIGALSPKGTALLEWRSRFWSMGANIAETLFDGGNLIGKLDYANATLLNNIASLEQVTLQAYEEVESALISIEQRKKQKNALDRSITSSKNFFEIIQDRYLSGLNPYLDVVEAEKFYLTAQLDRNRVFREEYFATFNLIKALGGGFDVHSPEPYQP